MRFSVRWLRNYLQTDLSLPRLVEALTQCGLEVEQVIDLGLVSGKLVAGRILDIEAIPGAEKIRLTTVQADEAQPLKIVCGAKNIEVGDVVPVARFGMKFPDGFELKPRKIMGIEGQGMLCSAKELGIAEDAAGIWHLPGDAEIGKPFDAVIEISITPNRPDALSIVGVARDLAAKINATKVGRATFVMPDIGVDEDAEKTEAAARVSIQAKEDCPRYTARVVKNIKIGPSPRWMQSVLESAGLRPINNVVDITNFVLLEMGHPLHAFDLDKLTNHQIVVRTAKNGETMTTLDGQARKLEAGDLLICDAEKPVALAGIMGGQSSEVTEQTHNILIESAYFRPQTIRKTSKRLDHSTDASYRFERGTDPKKLTAALNRAAQLMAELGNGQVLRGIIDVVGKMPEKEPIAVRIARLNKLLGIELSGREIVDVLAPLGFEVQRSDREVIVVSVPSHRPDVAIEADIIEEVGRIIGYDRIPEKPVQPRPSLRPPTPLVRARDILAQAAVARGLCEAINFSFVSPEWNGAVNGNDDQQVRLANPLTVELSVMRRSLLPSLLQNVKHNLNHGAEEVALFELGSSFVFPERLDSDNDPKTLTPPAIEVPTFAAILAGKVKPSWRDAEFEYDFFHGKGLAESFLQALGLQKLVVEESPETPWLHPGRSARFLLKGQPIAVVGELHPALLKEWDIRHRVVYIELPLEGPILTESARDKIRGVSKFPASTRDIALLVDRGARSLDLERTIRKAGKELLTGVRLFDVYEGKHVAEGKKSLAYSLTYRAEDRTLTDEEVNSAHEAVVAALAKEHGATLRA